MAFVYPNISPSDSDSEEDRGFGLVSGSNRRQEETFDRLRQRERFRASVNARLGGFQRPLASTFLPYAEREPKVKARRKVTKFGGHEEEFVDKVEEDFICSICILPCRDPHLTKCCGQHYCESCLDHHRRSASNEPDMEYCCPHCRSKPWEDFQHFLNKNLKRKIDSLQVYCKNHNQGCEWVRSVGDEKALADHLDPENSTETCGYVEVECPRTSCNISILRKDLEHHLDSECKQRPYQCEYCGHEGTYQSICEGQVKDTQVCVTFLLDRHQSKHYDVCQEFPLKCNQCGDKTIKRKEMHQHKQELCPEGEVTCPFEEIGCEVDDLHRKDIGKHMEENSVDHQLLMLLSIIQQEMRECDREEERQKREKERNEAIVTNLDLLLTNCTISQRLPLQSIRSVIDNFCVNEGKPLTLSVPDFSKYKRSSKTWYSPPFYVDNIAGMKLRLTLYPNGINGGAHGYVSLKLHVLKGDMKTPSKCECKKICIGLVDDDDQLIDFDSGEATICECKSSVVQEHGELELYCNNKFVRQSIAEGLCSEDTLQFEIGIVGSFVCRCDCHKQHDYSLFGMPHFGALFYDSIHVHNQ